MPGIVNQAPSTKFNDVLGWRSIPRSTKLQEACNIDRFGSRTAIYSEIKPGGGGLLDFTWRFCGKFTFRNSNGNCSKDIEVPTTETPCINSLEINPYYLNFISQDAVIVYRIMEIVQKKILKKDSMTHFPKAPQRQKAVSSSWRFLVLSFQQKCTPWRVLAIVLCPPELFGVVLLQYCFQLETLSSCYTAYWF